MNEGRLRIYRLLPDAPETDPGWDISPNVGVVTVRAQSPADARIVASQGEPDFPEVDSKPGDGVRTGFASALRNDKLYRVEEEDSGNWPDDGEREVLDGLDAPSGVIKPLTE